MSPLVSVCIPTYNAAKYFRECLDSILAQTFTDFEILIVDNCSNDDTLSIAEGYANKFDKHRFRIIRNQQNIGGIANHNRCVELAKGEWIKFVHADDLISHQCLEQMLAATNPESKLVSCRRDFMFEPGTDQETKQYFQKILSLYSIDALFPEETDISSHEFCNAVLNNIAVNIVGEPSAILLHQSVFYQLGFFNDYLVSKFDTEFWTRIGVNTGLTYVPNTLATTRIHGESLTSNLTTSFRFRKVLLDKVIILHDFALNPVYAPLRSAADSCKPRINLTNILAQHAYGAKRMTNKSFSKYDVDGRSEWQEVVKNFPAISKYANLNLIQKLEHYSKRINQKINLL